MSAEARRPKLIRVPAGVGHLVITRKARNYYVPAYLDAVWDLEGLIVTMRVRIHEPDGRAFLDHAEVSGRGPDAPFLTPSMMMMGDDDAPEDAYNAFIEGRSPIEIMGRPDAERDDLERHELAAAIYNEGPRRGAAQRVADHFGISRTGAYHLINKAKAEGLIAPE